MAEWFLLEHSTFPQGILYKKIINCDSMFVNGVQAYNSASSQHGRKGSSNCRGGSLATEALYLTAVLLWIHNAKRWLLWTLCRTLYGVWSVPSGRRISVQRVGFSCGGYFLASASLKETPWPGASLSQTAPFLYSGEPGNSSLDKTDETHAIRLIHDERFIGWITFFENNDGEPELGMSLIEECRNKGYGPEAAMLFVNYLHHAYGLRQVSVRIEDKNCPE